MKKNDFVLPIILVLIAFFLPCAIYGYNRHKENDLEGGNPNHLPRVGDVLYFYNDADVLIGTYKCNNSDKCFSAITTVDDMNFKHHEGMGTAIGLVGENRYVFIQDGSLINLYDLETNQIIAKFLSIKNYGVPLEGGNLIVRGENGNYGLFDYSRMIVTVNIDYSWMGLADNLTEEGALRVSHIAVQKDELYYIIDSSGNALSVQSEDAIYDYDENYIYYINRGGSYYVRDYKGNSLIDTAIVRIDRLTKANVIYTLDGTILVYDNQYKTILGNVTPNDGEYKLVEKEDSIEIYTSADELISEVSLTPKAPDPSEDGAGDADDNTESNPDAGTEED